MVTGADLIFVFQTGILISAYFVFLHVFFKQDFNPISTFIFAIGLLVIQFSNYFLNGIFAVYMIEDNEKIIFMAPIFEEVFKYVVMIYLVIQDEDNISPSKIIFYGSILGLGFAAGELVGYGLLYGSASLLIRSLLLMFGHPLFGAIIGFGLYIQIIDKNKEERILLKNHNFISFLLISSAILLHMFWNLISIVEPMFLIVNVVIHSSIGFYLIKYSLRLSD